jgi:hypothetical protein
MAVRAKVAELTRKSRAGTAKPPSLPGPADHELDLQLFLDREEEKADRLPDEWWEDRLDSLVPEVAEQARQSLAFLVNPHCLRVDVLEALRAVRDHREHYTPPREAVIAQARSMRATQQDCADLSLAVSFFGCGAKLEQLLDAVTSELDAERAKLVQRAEAVKRDPDLALNQDIYRLVRLIERARGRAHYGHLSKLLAAVGVDRTPDGLKALASRKARRTRDPRPKKEIARKVIKKGPRGRPRKNEAMKRREGGVEIRIEDEAHLEALMTGNPHRRAQRPRSDD